MLLRNRKKLTKKLDRGKVRKNKNPLSEKGRERIKTVQLWRNRCAKAQMISYNDLSCELHKPTRAALLMQGSESIGLLVSARIANAKLVLRSLHQREFGRFPPYLMLRF